MNEHDFRLEFDNDGTLHVRGREGWREPICPVCNEPIRWVLDMASFTTGDHTYAHARCVWTPEAFDNEKKAAAVPALVEALGDFANPQHWAVRREFKDPVYVWIGTYQRTPVEHASDALTAYHCATAYQQATE